jgi:hypothetical protein
MHESRKRDTMKLKVSAPVVGKQSFKKVDINQKLGLASREEEEDFEPDEKEYLIMCLSSSMF